VEDLSVNFARTGDINQLQHGLNKFHEKYRYSSQKVQQKSKRSYDNRENYSSPTTGDFVNNSSAYMSGRCKMCGKNVIHLDGCCDVYKSTGIRDSNYDSQANYALDSKSKQRQVLFDGVQDCAQLFHLTLRVPSTLFEGMIVHSYFTNGTAANLTDIACVS
jgi:hypothetical protein